MGYASFIDDVGALAMGATTYSWVLEHQRRTGEAWSYTQPCWVLTHRDLPLAVGKRLLEGRTDLRLTRVEQNRAFACLWYDVQRPG